MKRIVLLALAAFLCLSGQSQAEFLIDSFKFVDNIANDGNGVLVHAAGGGNIYAEVETTGTMSLMATPGSGYTLTTPSAGDTFRITYTWTPNGTYPGGATFDALQSISGLQLAPIPQAFIGWDINIGLGAAGLGYAGPALGAPGATTINLDDATELEFTYTYNSGLSFGQFGGPGSPLFATPEPTGMVMMGSIAVVGLLRRRRKGRSIQQG